MNTNDPRILGDGQVTEEVLQRIVAHTGLAIAATVEVPAYEGTVATTAQPGIAYLKESLEAAIGWYEMENRSADNPSPSQLSKRLEAIAVAASRLAELLPPVDVHSEDEALSHRERHAAWKLRQQAQLMGEAIHRASGRGFRHYPPTPWSMIDNTYIDYHAPSQLRDIVEGTRQISAWAFRAASIVKARVRSGRRNRHQGDSALNKYIDQLGGIFLEAFRRAPGRISRDASDGQPGGPYFRFVKECIGLVGIFPTDEAIAKRLERRGQIKLEES